MPNAHISPPCNSHISYLSTFRPSGDNAILIAEEPDTWFDAEDSIRVEEVWFDASDTTCNGKNSPEQNADSLVPFTEDCRRSIQQLMATLGNHEESKILSFCLSKLLPGVPANLAIAANSLYTAITERRNIDTAILQALGLASWFLPDNTIFSQSACYIRETVTGWLGEAFVHQFLGDAENQSSSTVFTALAVTALVAKHWMSDQGAAQRGLLRLPASIANLFIRVNHCWNTLGNMAGNNIPPNTAPLQISTFGVDAAEITVNPNDPSPVQESQVTLFSSNSTSTPGTYATGSVQTRRPPTAPETTSSMRTFKTEITVAVSTESPGQTPGLVKSPKQNKTQFTSPIKMQNDKVIDMLRDKGLLKTVAEGETNPVSKEKKLSAAAGYLFNNKEKVADYDNKIKLLASSILAVGSPENKTKAAEPSLLQANSLTREWVFNNILGDSPAQYIKNKIDNGTLPRDANIEMLYDQLLYGEMIKTGRVNYQKINIQELDKLYELWDCFLKDEMPFLNLTDNSVLSLKLNDYNFAPLYSGSRLLQRSSGKPYTYSEAITAGESMWNSALREGITESNLNDYSAPALFFLDASPLKKSDWHDGNISTLISSYVKYRNEVRKLHEDIKCKHHKYICMAQLWLTKEKLADNIISQCPVLPPVPEGLAFHNANEKQLSDAAGALAKKSYLDGNNAPCIDAPANLEREYQKRTSSVADAFYEIDHYLIQSAINALPKNDYKFISSKNTELYPADIDMANFQMKASPTAGLTKYRDLIIPLARTKLIAARRGRNRGIERIYALKAITKGNKGYEIFRVDRDIEKYIKNGLLDYSFTSGYDINQSNSSIKANGRNFNYSFNIFTSDPINEKTQENIILLVNWLKNEHRGDLYRGLYAAGHERTDFQRVWNEAKRMIPFYDCVAGSNSAPWQVVPQCLLEAVSFIPTVAQPPNLNKRFGADIASRTLSSHSKK